MLRAAAVLPHVDICCNSGSHYSLLRSGNCSSRRPIVGCSRIVAITICIIPVPSGYQLIQTNYRSEGFILPRPSSFVPHSYFCRTGYINVNMLRMRSTIINTYYMRSVGKVIKVILRYPEVCSQPAGFLIVVGVMLQVVIIALCCAA